MVLSLTSVGSAIGPKEGFKALTCTSKTEKLRAPQSISCHTIRIRQCIPLCIK